MTRFLVEDFETHLDAWQSGRASLTELAPPSRTLQKPPRFVLGAVPAALGMPMLGELNTGPIRCYAARDVRMGVDGVLMDGSTMLTSTMFNLPDYHVGDIARALETVPERPVRRVAGQAVWLCGPGGRVYGHWLVDFLPRLYVLARCGHDLAKLRYVVADPLAGFVIPMLAAFGIAEDQLLRYEEHKEMLEVEDLLVVTNLRRGTRLHPLAKAARDLLLDRAAAVAPQSAEPRAGSNRIFVVRRDAEPSRLLKNRGAIERIAEDAGFALVQPELLGMADQIALFRGARQIAGEYGSGLHACMFATAGTVTCAIRGSSNHPGFIQSAISDVFDQAVGYVLAPAPSDAIDQELEVSETDFRVALLCMSLIAAETP